MLLQNREQLPTSSDDERGIIAALSTNKIRAPKHLVIYSKQIHRREAAVQSNFKTVDSARTDERSYVFEKAVHVRLNTARVVLFFRVALPSVGVCGVRKPRVDHENTNGRPHPPACKFVMVILPQSLQAKPHYVDAAVRL